MRKTKELPTLTDKQVEFLIMYRELEVKLRRPPSLSELHDARGGESRTAVQALMDQLVRKGLAEKAEYVPVGGGTTELGKLALRRLKRSRERE